MKLEGAFSPSVFVSNVTEWEAYPGSIIAHEMDHALGLTHTEIWGNPMTQGDNESCRPELTEEQARGGPRVTPLSP